MGYKSFLLFGTYKCMLDICDIFKVIFYRDRLDSFMSYKILHLLLQLGLCMDVIPDNPLVYSSKKA